MSELGMKITILYEEVEKINNAETPLAFMKRLKLNGFSTDIETLVVTSFLQLTATSSNQIAKYVGTAISHTCEYIYESYLLSILALACEGSCNPH